MNQPVYARFGKCSGGYLRRKPPGMPGYHSPCFAHSGFKVAVKKFGMVARKVHDHERQPPMSVHAVEDCRSGIQDGPEEIPLPMHYRLETLNEVVDRGVEYPEEQLFLRPEIIVDHRVRDTRLPRYHRSGCAVVAFLEELLRCGREYFLFLCHLHLFMSSTISALIAGRRLTILSNDIVNNDANILIFPFRCSVFVQKQTYLPKHHRSGEQVDSYCTLHHHARMKNERRNIAVIAHSLKKPQ